ncbi:MAG: acetyl-CoA carboxylase biotin carboxylase subunit [Pseudomonadota bacterium]
MKPINRLLIANRGEIACRVMRTARQLGVDCIAVYAEADANAPHVKLADQAVAIGPSPVSQSYLSIENVINAAIDTGADAIHPGYGFLSENAAFAEACVEAGITFIGPPVNAIAVMGDKARAKRAMIDAGVPCVPGYQGKDQSPEVLLEQAQSIGFPLMVKAAAGGGGRGMRLVEKPDMLAQAIDLARSEAANAFGDDVLILEKAIIRPRHVEIQVFGDTHGNIIHLGERDCSVQRRHQKVLEEAPCPVMTPQLREEMGAAAITAARAVDYVGAGTVEFLLGEDRAFYFLEMNTRLQVEHPVTEEVTGLDLVALQLHVAAGGELGLTQTDIRLDGHSIEARLYAEDPQHDFLPSTGEIHAWCRPSGDGVRIDDGIECGGTVSPFYDSMVAKIIATGDTRELARIRLLHALQNTALVGPVTNRDFLIDALGRDAFCNGEATTAFIAEEYGEHGFSNAISDTDHAVAAALHFASRRRTALEKSLGVNKELLNWSSAGAVQSVFNYGSATAPKFALVSANTADTYDVTVGECKVPIKIAQIGDHTATLYVDGRKRTAFFFPENDAILHITTGDRQYSVHDFSSGDADTESGGDGIVRAPMHGVMIEISVAEGDNVKAGDRLAVLEAMKMQHEIFASIDGLITKIAVESGAQLSDADLIMEIEPDV